MQYISLVCFYVLYRWLCVGQYMVFKIILVHHLPTNNAQFNQLGVLKSQCMVAAIFRMKLEDGSWSPNQCTFLGFSKNELNFKKEISTWNWSNILESLDYHMAFMAFISRHNSLLSRQKAWMENNGNRPKLKCWIL